MPRAISPVAITPTDHVADGVHILFMPPAGDQIAACLIAANVLSFDLVPFHQHPGKMAFVVCLGSFLESFDGLRLPPIKCECLPVRSRHTAARKSFFIFVNLTNFRFVPPIWALCAQLDT